MRNMQIGLVLVVPAAPVSTHHPPLTQATGTARLTSSLSLVRVRPCRMTVDGKHFEVTLPPTTDVQAPVRFKGEAWGVFPGRDVSCVPLSNGADAIARCTTSDDSSAYCGVGRGPRYDQSGLALFLGLRQCLGEPLINGITRYPCGATNSTVPICSKRFDVYYILMFMTNIRVLPVQFKLSLEEQCLLSVHLLNFYSLLSNCNILLHDPFFI